MMMEESEANLKKSIKKQKEKTKLLKQALSEVNAWLDPMTTRLLQILNPLSKGVIEMIYRNLSAFYNCYWMFLGTKVIASKNMALLFEMFSDLLAEVTRVSGENMKKCRITSSSSTDLDQFPLDSMVKLRSYKLS